MRTGAFYAVLLVAVLSASVAGAGQYADRDSSGAPKTSAAAPSPEARIDINRATVDQLMKIPGMTRTWAARIVRFRPYRTKADLLQHGIVSSEVYRRIEDYIIAHRV